MRTATLYLGSCVLAVTLCCSSHRPLPAQQTRPELSVKDKVRECVFRYQFVTFGVKDKYNKHFFVGNGIQGKIDPAPPLIAKLQSRAYSVKGISQCSQSPRGVFDMKTKARGLAFVVENMKFVSGEHVLVNANFFRDGKGGNEAIYTVDNIKGRWKVTNCKIMEVS